MKKNLIFLFIPALFISLVAFQYGNQDDNIRLLTDEENIQLDTPDNILVILDRSCLPCHGEDGSGKAKMKWNYEKMSNYSKTKLISKLGKIEDKVNDEKMPPAKNIKKHPERKLSDDDKKILMEWAENAAVKLTGGE